jgi:hypothetical protein
MAISIKSLAAGTITNTTAKVAINDGVALASKSYLVKNITLVNKHTAQAVLESISLRRYVNEPEQTERKDFPVTPLDTTIPAKNQLVFDTELTLANSLNSNAAAGADQLVIKFSTIAGGGVSYVINGFEKDI